MNIWIWKPNLIFVLQESRFRLLAILLIDLLHKFFEHSLSFKFVEILHWIKYKSKFGMEYLDLIFVKNKLQFQVFVQSTSILIYQDNA